MIIIKKEKLLVILGILDNVVQRSFKKQHKKCKYKIIMNTIP